MTPFINDDFLLQTKTAQKLYFNHAAHQPIIDYHNHLPADEIATNKQFKTITEVWLNGDHYKWRAMRALGIDEAFITGNKSDKEKFIAWAKCVPHTMRNPLYHWTHLELKRYFGIDELLNGNNAEKIYDQTNEQLQQDSHRAVDLLQQMKVETVCTTDDPKDDLQHHKAFAQQNLQLKMLPSFRPDKAININDGNFLNYIINLGKRHNTSINNIEDLLGTLQQSMDYFEQVGCKLSDYGLDTVYASKCSESQANTILQKRLNEEVLSTSEIDQFKSYVLHQLCTAYSKKGWVQQFHLGALRNNSARMLAEIGPDTGFDSMGDLTHGQQISNLFSNLDEHNQLARTILYNINPKDNALFATMVGNFNDGTTKGKVQWGSGWWFLDQKQGMEDQLNTLSVMGVLSNFVGMLTDSRSFLSFPRHEYFRRILCNLIGNDVENGLLPASEIDFLGKMVENISYHNAKDYFKF